ncbi:MAG: hypothetical protein AAFN11_00275 [Chloroflexota bacterium]
MNRVAVVHGFMYAPHQFFIVLTLCTHYQTNLKLQNPEKKHFDFDEQGYICYCGHEWYSVIQADDEDNDSINWLILISEDEVPKPIVVSRKAIR